MLAGFIGIVDQPTRSSRCRPETRSESRTLHRRLRCFMCSRRPLLIRHHFSRMPITRSGLLLFLVFLAAALVGTARFAPRRHRGRALRDRLRRRQPRSRRDRIGRPAAGTRAADSLRADRRQRSPPSARRFRGRNVGAPAFAIAVAIVAIMPFVSAIRTRARHPRWRAPSPEQWDRFEAFLRQNRGRESSSTTRRARSARSSSSNTIPRATGSSGGPTGLQSTGRDASSPQRPDDHRPAAERRRALSVRMTIRTRTSRRNRGAVPTRRSRPARTARRRT